MELLIEPGDDLLGRLPLAAPFIDRLEPEEEEALVEGPAVEAGAAHDLAGDDLRFLGEDRLGLGGHLHGGLDRRLRRQLNDAQAVALVFGGHKAGGNGGEGHAGESHAAEQYKGHQPP